MRYLGTIFWAALGLFQVWLVYGFAADSRPAWAALSGVGAMCCWASAAFALVRAATPAVGPRADVVIGGVVAEPLPCGCCRKLTVVARGRAVVGILNPDQRRRLMEQLADQVKVIRAGRRNPSAN